MGGGIDISPPASKLNKELDNLSKTVEIKSNIAGKIRKIRGKEEDMNGVVYQSITSVLGELGQNSQRGIKAAINKGKLNSWEEGRLVIEMDYSSITFTDNGLGCDNPQDVLEFDKSGFGYGFGEGFSSVFTLADYIRVESNGWMLQFDVLEILESGEFDVAVWEQGEGGTHYSNGFRVHLEGKRIEHHYNELHQFILDMGALLPMEVEFNGEVVEKKDLMQDLPSYLPTDFKYEVNNELYTAVISPGSYQDFKVYYESRYVCDIWMYGATGNIVLKDDAVTLKAPDRRSIVDDTKYWDFKKQLRDDIKAMFKEFILVATDEQLNELDDKIADYVDGDDLVDVLKMDDNMFEIKFRDEEPTGVTEEVEDEEPETILDYVERQHDDETVVQGVSNLGNLVEPEYRKDIRPTVKNLKGHKLTAWVRGVDVNRFKSEIRELEYYGYKIVIAKNKLYELAFRALGMKELCSLDKDTTKEHGIKNVELKTKKEQRFLAILRKIEQFYGVEDVFYIADLSMEINTMVDGTVMDTETKQVNGIAKGDKIYLDRKSMEFNKFRMPSEWNNAKVGINDIRFLMRNLDTIAHELAHRLYGTDDLTNEHQSRQRQIAREIADLF